MPTLHDITELMREHDRIHAPGSESDQWGEFCANAVRQYGTMPYSDKAYDTPVDDEFARFWSAVAEHDYKAAAGYGDVPNEWIEDNGDTFSCAECGQLRDRDDDLHDLGDGRDLCGMCFNRLVDNNLSEG